MDHIRKLNSNHLSSNFENSKFVIDAGADILVSGTTIFRENEGNIKKNIETLRIS